MLKPEIGAFKEVDDIVKERYIPIHMMVEVTRRCNINCVHCYNIKDRAHLTYDQLDNIFSQLREAGTLFITLTGGEIFSRPDAVKILYLARDYGFDIRMITNGTLITREKALVMADVSPSEVGVSILGGCEETHDLVTRSKGAFKKAIQGIKYCKEEGVPVHIKCTLMRENFDELEDLKKLAKSLGVTYLIDPIVTPRDDGDTANYKHRLGDQLLEKMYMDKFKDMQIEKQTAAPKREKGLPCDAGTAFGAISADGSIYPCIQLPKAVGNILTENFKQVWENSPILYKIRNVKPEEFNHCSSCEGACDHCAGLAYLETGDMFGPTSSGCMIGGIYKKYKAQKAGVEYAAEPCGPQCSCH